MFPFLLRYNSRHWFVVRCCIDFNFSVSIYLISRDWFVDDFEDCVFIDFRTKLVPTLPLAGNPFPNFSIMFRKGCCWRFLGLFCHAFGFMSVMFGTLSAPFWMIWHGNPSLSSPKCAEHLQVPRTSSAKEFRLQGPRAVFWRR